MPMWKAIFSPKSSIEKTLTIHKAVMPFMLEAGPKNMGNLMTRERVTASHMVIAMSNATIDTRKGIWGRPVIYGKVRKGMTRSMIKTRIELLLQV